MLLFAQEQMRASASARDRWQRPLSDNAIAARWLMNDTVTPHRAQRSLP
jgi:hypothetical protein